LESRINTITPPNPNTRIARSISAMALDMKKENYTTGWLNNTCRIPAQNMDYISIERRRFSSNTPNSLVAHNLLKCIGTAIKQHRVFHGHW